MPAHVAAVPCPGPTRRRALLALPSHGRWVRTARHFTADLLRRWGIADEDRDSAVLIVGELAVNAVEHGHADTTVLMAQGDGMLLIAVADSGDRMSRPEPPAADFDPDEHGRGTTIVAALAHRMDVRVGEDGCRVSVALRLSAPAAGGRAEPVGADR
ncbi:ATP-binding protein [Streptomyces sp. NPDC055078]